MQKQIIPDSCLGEDAKYEGTVTLEMPSYPERLRFAKEHGLDLKKYKGKEQDEDTGIGMLEMLASISEKIQKNIVAVDLTKKDSSEKVTSVEDLYSDPDCDSVVNDICMLFLSGFKTGKNSPGHSVPRSEPSLQVMAAT